MKKLKLILLIAILAFGFTNQTKACTIIAVGKKASKDGSVIVSHTDCGDNSRFKVMHGRKFPKGSMAPVYWGLQDVRQPLDSMGKIIGYIPQVEQTYTYIRSAYSHINEYQLAIGESTMSQREELKIVREESKQIITIEQAQIFALERCKTAREALELITHLLDTYGFLPSCVDESECLAIADPNEVWILEVFSVGPGWVPGNGKPGAIWAAQRLPDDNATLIANWSIIKEINLKDKDNFRASSNYKSVAIERGWYNPDSGKPFIWQDAYAPIPREWATSRLWMFYSKYAPEIKDMPDRNLKSPFDTQNPYIQYVEPLSLYPFSCKPVEKISVQDVMAMQRYTFEGTIYDMSKHPAYYVPDGKGGMKYSNMATPFPTRNMRELLGITWRRNVARGGYGMVAQLRSWLPDEIGGIYWVYLDNQAVGPYLPIYCGIQQIPDSYATFDPDQFDDASAKWTYDEVDNLLYLNWQEGFKLVKAEQSALESAFFDEIQKEEAELQSLLKSNHNQALKQISEKVANRAQQNVDAYRNLRKTLITKFTNNRQGINFQ
ncbi:MAG: peptidase [Bacteroidetes bacterium HGW-Bacteroidetes-9]|jgi:dipeptidase|nr:MAG: peptidase [Bacteroidetes bacterium HGW-Bacteroidetes-9]